MSDPITPIPVEEVPAATAQANLAIEAMHREVNRRVTAHTDIRTLVYFNPAGVTPAQIFAAWGTRAKSIFEAGLANALDIRAAAQRCGMDPDAVFPASAYVPPIPVTIHEDGTVTTP